MVITGVGTVHEDQVSTKSQDNEAELTAERVWWGGKQRQPAWGLQMAEELTASGHHVNFLLQHGLVQ